MTLRDRVIDRYRNQVGRAKHEVTTPALLLDLDVARRNIEQMAADIRTLSASLRPHIKAHKCAQLAQMQVDAGAVGVACATVWEAIVMAGDAGVQDVMLANQVVDDDKIQALARIAGENRITVAVDEENNVLQLSQAAARADTEFGIVIEIDVGMNRAGVRTSEHAVKLAESIAQLPALTFRGVHGYEGHCMSYTDPAERERATCLANQLLTEAAERLTAKGHACEIVSAGGTGTYLTTGANRQVTEVQAGSYVLMDGFHERLLPDRFGVALTVLGSVISRQGSTVVLDCGRKSVSTDFGVPQLVRIGDATVRAFAEEHCLVDFVGSPSLRVGDRAETMVDYAPTAVGLHDVFHIVERGVVTDIWAVNPRGSGPPLPPA